MTLPKDSYVAQFVGPNDNAVWPTFVEEKYEDLLCPDGLEDGSVMLTVPTVRVAECESLIRNGDAEESDVNHTYWLHRHGGIRLVPGEGINGSNALGQLNSTRADLDTIAQFLDTHCLKLMRFRQYEVVAFVKLVNETTGENYTCSPVVESYCPELGIYRQSSEGLWSRNDVATVVAASSPDPSGYQRIHGVRDVTYEVVNASSIFLYIQRHVEGVAMFVDNVSMKLISLRNEGDCNNLVFNGDFATGDSRLWFDAEGDALSLVSPGYAGSSDYALGSFEGNMLQHIRIGCMKVGALYSAKASFKLIGPDGLEFACRTRRATDETRCPVMQLRVQFDGEEVTHPAAGLAGNPSDTEWNSLLGGFEASEQFANAESIRLKFVRLYDVCI